MKILYLTNDISVLGGIEKILLMKAEYFSKNFKYDVTILTQNNKKNYFFSSAMENKSFKVISFNKNLYNNFFLRQFQRIVYFFELHKLVLNKNYDLIISTGSIVDVFLPFLKNKAKIIKEIHTTKKIKINIFSFKYLYNIIQEIWLKKYDKVVILTNEDKRNWKLSNLKVIANSLPFYSEKISKCENKKIISVGRLEYEKGYDILIDVWKIISKKYPDWILEIYGDGRERKKLQEKINILGLEKTFLLRGATENIQDKYLESSIYVMSSRFEGFGLVLIESMSCGLPVVSFDCPCGPKDIIKNKEDGFLIKFGDIEAMAEKIEYLILNKEKRKLFGKNARNNVQRFSQKNIMNQWKELFENF